GVPKGVMLHQYNYSGVIRIHKERLAEVTDKDTSMCFLPITHIFERAWTYLCLERGVQVYVNKRPIEIQQTILEVQPTLMCTVPRYWEKVYAAILEKMETLSPALKKIFTWAIQVGKVYNLEYYRHRKSAPILLRLKYILAEKLVFNKIKSAAGLTNLHFFPCAGSRLADDINEFIHSLGINLVYGYGLTESTATVSCYLPSNQNYIIGSIGKIMPQVEVKISEEGEILLKGKTITSGYYKRPEANAEAFVDGWFKTGDAGHIDEDNNLYITDRIKDLFKTAGGKYVAPQMLESRLSELKFIDQIAIIGDQRKYVTALIVPTFDTLKIYAANHAISYQSIAELIANPTIIEFYTTLIKDQMKDLAKYEQIKRFTLLPKAFTMEDGLLTNTLKLKRKEVARIYAQEIEKMYID
nr:AMP-binding protein [Paludibacteraceae bacterium]